GKRSDKTDITDNARKRGNDLMSRLLGGPQLLASCTLAYNGVSLHTDDGLCDTGANGYAFMSEKFAKKLIEKLRVPVHDDFDPRWLGDYQGNPTELVDRVVRANLTVQNRTVLDEPFIVMKQGHDLILGKKWFAAHGILVDCARERLLFPPEWLPD
ncbi:hypothetical protein QBC37DRAFT_256563, partial [Rhypophila decipiens]